MGRVTSAAPHLSEEEIAAAFEGDRRHEGASKVAHHLERFGGPS